MALSQQVWTAEMDAEVARLRATGLSYFKIAHQMGLTKSAVLGRRNRLGHCKPMPERPAITEFREARRQQFPPAGNCLHSNETAVPYTWCSAPTGSCDMPWCANHRAIVFQPHKDSEA